MFGSRSTPLCLLSLVFFGSLSQALHLIDVGDVFPQCIDLCTTYNDMNNNCNSKSNTSAIISCECAPDFLKAMENCYDCQASINQTQEANLQGFLDNAVGTCNDPNFNTPSSSIASQQVVPTIVATAGKNAAGGRVGLSVLGVCAAMLTSMLAW